MKKIIIVFLIVFYALTSLSDINITFINPGRSNETFWVMVSDFMSAAAKDLGIDLEIFYAERNFLRQVTIMREIAKQESKPDYVVIVNEKLIASRLLNISEEHNIKTFMILNKLNDEQVRYEGLPRQIRKNWLGTLIPNNIDAGYMIADSLLKEIGHKKSEIKLFAIAGNRATPASVERVQGLEKVLAENPNIKHLGTVFAEWSRNEAYIRTQGMLNRYDGDIDLIWGVNDLGALGALRAVEELGLKAGKDVYISGLNWSPEALDAVKDERLVATVGGHFMVGGWSLVLINDYHNGKDFLVTEGTTELKTNSFGIIDSSNVDDYLKNFGTQDWSKIDFKKFSKIYNSEIKKYNFDLEKILEQFD
jgi:ABC-type sugar transport system substrate-binding protein